MMLMFSAHGPRRSSVPVVNDGSNARGMLLAIAICVHAFHELSRIHSCAEVNSHIEGHPLES